MSTTGRCLCGEIGYSFEGEPLCIAHCHCASCRRQTSSAVATFVGLRRDQLTYLSGEPAVYHSSPGVDRSFCARCGAPIAYENQAGFPGEIHLYVGTLDEPERFVPTAHVFADEQLAWFEVHDALPRFAQSGRNASPARRGPRQADQ